MSIKSLNIKYIIYFLLSIFILLGLVTIFKKKELNSYLDFYKNNINIKYEEYYKDYQNTSEFIYYNEFVKNREFINILEKNSKLEIKNLKNSLYKYFLNSYTFYKTLELRNVSFYLLNNQEILNMEGSSNDSLTLQIVKDVIENKKDVEKFKMIGEKVYLIFSKPIFNEKLELLGVINFEYDFDLLITKLSKNNNFRYDYFLSNNLSLDENKIINMKNRQKTSLINHLSKGEEFAIILRNKFTEYPVIFLPILHSSFYDNHLYLLAFNIDKDNYISKISKYLIFGFFAMTFIIAIILYILYKLKSLKNQKFIISKNYKNIYTQIDDYAMIVDLSVDKKFTFATKSFYKLSGYSKDELLGKRVDIIKHPDVSEIFFDNLWEELKTNKSWKGEIKSQDKFGNSFWVKVIIFPKYDVNNEIIAYSSISVNITDTKQLEKINKLLKEDLSNKLNEIKVKDKTLIDSTKVELMSKILDSFSHQWKRSISNISYENLNLKINSNKEKVDIKKLFEINERINLELKDLSSMLNEVKYLFDSKEKTKANLLKVLNTVINEVENELKINSIKIKLHIKEDVSVNIFSNELKNIFLNIIKNSIEQKKLNDLEKVTIVISIIREKNDLIIKIEDDIKGTFKNIINEVFTSSLNKQDRKYPNNFLYLSILLIEKNKGLFWCDNQEYNTKYFIKLNSEVL